MSRSPFILCTSPNFGALFEFDLEIGRIFCGLKQQRKFQEVLDADIVTPIKTGGEDEQRRIMRDCVTPGAHN